LGKLLGAGLQPLAIQFPLESPETLIPSWNRIAIALRKEGLPMPSLVLSQPELRRVLGSETWRTNVLKCASEAGLDPAALERPLEAFRASEENPLAAPRTLQALLAPPQIQPPRQPWTVFNWFHSSPPERSLSETFTLPLRLSEAAQDRLEPEIRASGARMVGTRPLFKAIKAVAREALRDIIALALVAVGLVVALFGRRLRFVILALVPLIASQAGALGILGWTGEPLTFLSLVAIPIALGVSVDTAMNLLHRARLEPHAAARVARVNAVCAGTTLAGFGGLVFSGYRGLQGLGLACVGGTGLALLVTQWLLPWMIEKWPLRKEHR
jgi:predicted exporter